MIKKRLIRFLSICLIPTLIGCTGCTRKTIPTSDELVLSFNKKVSNIPNENVLVDFETDFCFVSDSQILPITINGNLNYTKDNLNLDCDILDYLDAEISFTNSNNNTNLHSKVKIDTDSDYKVTDKVLENTTYQKFLTTYFKTVKEYFFYEDENVNDVIPDLTFNDFIKIIENDIKNSDITLTDTGYEISITRILNNSNNTNALLDEEDTKTIIKYVLEEYNDEMEVDINSISEWLANLEYNLTMYFTNKKELKNINLNITVPKLDTGYILVDIKKMKLGITFK